MRINFVPKITDLPIYTISMNTDLLWNDRREWAKGLYLHTDTHVREIAATVGTDEATIGKWRDEGKWMEMKRSLLVSRKTQLERLYAVLEGLDEKTRGDDGEMNLRNLDAIAKVTAAINNLENDDLVWHAIDVAEQFTSWLMRRDTELAKQVTLLFDAYIKHKLAA